MKKGFTLAEVLITLGIIGVVAALVMPKLLPKIQERIRAEQIRMVKYKLTKATDQMKSLNLIGAYPSTSAFVEELKKHFKIAKICDASHLRECWPYDKVILQNGKEYEITKTQTGKQLKMKNDENKDYSSPNVGIMTADGTAMILSFNKKCEALDPVKTYGWSTEDNKPVTNATSNCISAVFDINGSQKPNKLNQDVALFNANGLGTDCAIKLGSKCFTAAFSPTPVMYSECLDLKEKGLLSSCTNYDKTGGDPWAGAVKQCNGKNNLPSLAELGQIASAIYVGHPNVGATTNINNTLKYNAGTASSIGLPEPSFYLWSSQEEGSNAYVRKYEQKGSSHYRSGRYTSNQYNVAICATDE